MLSDTKFTITQAAELAGVTRQTIHRFVKAGKLSAEKTPDGKTVIDKAELLRVFPNLMTPGMSQKLHPATSELVAVLREQVDFLRHELEVTREERDRLLGVVETQARILPKPEEPKLGWWRRWFG